MINTEIPYNILQKAAEKFGTPCLCYDKAEIKKWAEKLRTAVPRSANIVYAVKSGPNPYLFDYYQNLGFLFETASEGELRYLISVGVKPQNIWVSGQGKTADYLRYALEHGIGKFNLESGSELRLLCELTRGRSDVSCNLRINPNFTNERSVLRLDGCTSAFGVDEDDIYTLLQSEYGSVVNGLFMYAGSEHFSAADILHNTEYLFDLARRISEKLGIHFTSLDFGGGFGVPEDEKDGEIDLTALNHGLQSVMDKFLPLECFSALDTLLFESGRYLSARTAFLVTKIVDVKTSKGEQYVVTDGGIGSLGVKQHEYRLYPPVIRHLGKTVSGTPVKYRIVGPTCTPIDLTHPGCELDNPEIGDVICIPDCGAYCRHFSPTNFGGQVSPPEVVHDNGTFVLINDRGNLEYPYGKPESYATGSGNEVSLLLQGSCPVESDEVQNLAVAVGLIKINRNRCLVYDITGDGAYAIIMLKLFAHHGIYPDAVFSDLDSIRNYTHAVCFRLSDFDIYAPAVSKKDVTIFITGALRSDYDRTQAVRRIVKGGYDNFLTIESELIETIEHEFYSYYISHEFTLQTVCNILADYKSKQVFLEYIRTVLENDFWRLPVNSLLSKYWGYDEFKDDSFYIHIDDECWLNLGCCNGDTIFRYLENGYGFERIYTIDNDASALRRCRANLEMLPDTLSKDKIELIEIEFGCEPSQTRIDDYFLDKRVSLINMDLDGAELNVIKSAAETIRRDRPVLAVCAYHRREDLDVLLAHINEIAIDYYFYYRKYPSYPYHRYTSKEEIVLYAVPFERKSKQ